MKDGQVPDDDQVDIDDQYHDGCYKAMAHGAASASATDGYESDIARGMALGPVNPPQGTSAMGRGSNP